MAHALLRPLASFLAFTLLWAQEALDLQAAQFIQDPVEYDTRTHRSNMVVYDHLVEADLKQAAVVAAFAYPLPKPRPRPAASQTP